MKNHAPYFNVWTGRMPVAPSSPPHILSFTSLLPLLLPASLQLTPLPSSARPTLKRIPKEPGLQAPIPHVCVHDRELAVLSRWGVGVGGGARPALNTHQMCQLISSSAHRGLTRPEPQSRQQVLFL